MAILRNEADAEDVAQEAVLKGLSIHSPVSGGGAIQHLADPDYGQRGADAEKKRTSPNSWSRCDDRRDEEGNYLPRDFADWREIPSEALERKEVRQKLAEALASLGEKYREVFVLRDMQHLSIEETAKILGISAASVKTRLLRARLMLRDLLAPGLGEQLEQQAVFREGDKAMVVNCEEVWREISNYLDGEAEPGLRTAMEEHIRGCKRCTAVLQGTRNVIQLYGDERMSEVPLGFSSRLQRRLESSITGGRRGFLGWMVATAAAILVAGAFEAARLLARQSPTLALGAGAIGQGRTAGNDGCGRPGWQDVSRCNLSFHSRQSESAHHPGA